MATQQALTKDDLTHVHQGSGQSVQGQQEPHKHARKGRSKVMGQDRDQELAKGATSSSNTDFRGDTGEAEAKQNLGGQQWQKEGKGSKVLGGARPETSA